MEIIKITWQALIGRNGETCERCSKTYSNIENAINQLEPITSKLGVKVILEKKNISENNFEKDPLSSNRVFINGEPIEDILGLKVGKSVCCKFCKELECRTIIDKDKEIDEIPEKYILTAIFTKLREIF